MSSTAAIIVSHNGINSLQRCLPCLLGQDVPFAEIILVDNGSSDGTPEWLQKCYPAITLLQFSGNRGFSAAVNHGINRILQQRKHDCVALINNDVYLAADWHGEARRALLECPGCGSCATCLVQETRPELVDSCGIIWAQPGRADNYLSGQPSPSAVEPNREIFGACAAAALYRTALFREVGVFDEALFAYHEDVDLALRAQAAGWGCVFTPKARGLHRGHGSNRPFPLNGTWADYYNSRNRFCVLVASLPGAEWRRHWPVILAGEGKTLLASVRERRAAATAAGFSRGMMRLPGLLVKRLWRKENTI